MSDRLIWALYLLFFACSMESCNADFIASSVIVATARLNDDAFLVVDRNNISVVDNDLNKLYTAAHDLNVNSVYWTVSRSSDSERLLLCAFEPSHQIECVTGKLLFDNQISSFKRVRTTETRFSEPNLNISTTYLLTSAFVNKSNAAVFLFRNSAGSANSVVPPAMQKWFVDTDVFTAASVLTRKTTHFESVVYSHLLNHYAFFNDKFLYIVRTGQLTGGGSNSTVLTRLCQDDTSKLQASLVQFKLMQPDQINLVVHSAFLSERYVLSTLFFLVSKTVEAEAKWNVLEVDFHEIKEHLKFMTLCDGGQMKTLLTESGPANFPDIRKKIESHTCQQNQENPMMSCGKIPKDSSLTLYYLSGGPSNTIKLTLTPVNDIVDGHEIEQLVYSNTKGIASMNVLDDDGYKKIYISTNNGQLLELVVTKTKLAYIWKPTDDYIDSNTVSVLLTDDKNVYGSIAKKFFQLPNSIDRFNHCGACLTARYSSFADYSSLVWCVDAGDLKNGNCTDDCSAAYSFDFGCPPSVSKTHLFRNADPPFIRFHGNNFQNFARNEYQLLNISMCKETCNLDRSNDQGALNDRFDCLFSHGSKSIAGDPDCKFKFVLKTASNDVTMTYISDDTLTPDTNVDNSKSGLSWYFILIAALGALIFLILLAFLIWFMRREPKKDHNLLNNSEGTDYRFSGFRNSNLYGDPRQEYEGLAAEVPLEILIPIERLERQDPIGGGHFGIVRKGIYTPVGSDIPQEVAIKSIVGSSVSTKAMREFLQEGIMMNQFNSDRVLNLIGIAFTQGNVPLIVTPFLVNGDLLAFIRSADNNPNLRQLLNFATEIAEGMEYLHRLKFIHRDLACRNCMLDDGMNVKISDFGLSRDVYESQTYEKTDMSEAGLPLRWMPPESITHGLFSLASDVWSYGVVLWELMTRGEIPYSSVTTPELLHFLKTGNLLAQPPYCPEMVYHIMKQCWSLDAEDRPSMAELCRDVKQVIITMARRSQPIAPPTGQYSSQQQQSQMQTENYSRLNDTSRRPESENELNELNSIAFTDLNNRDGHQHGDYV